MSSQERYFTSAPVSGIVGSAVTAVAVVCVCDGAGRAARGGREKEFAATLIAVAADGCGRSLVAHLGDGAVLGRRGDGPVGAVSLPDNGEFANVTYFVTDEDAASRVRVSRFPRPGASATAPSAFLLFTDGVQGKLLGRWKSEAPAVAALDPSRWLRDHPAAVVKRSLRHALEHDFKPHAGDDLTLVLMTLPGAGGALIAPPARSADPSEAAWAVPPDGGKVVPPPTRYRYRFDGPLPRLYRWIVSNGRACEAD